MATRFVLWVLGVPLYGAASEGWTKVTPETAAAHGERMKREPKFTGTGMLDLRKDTSVRQSAHHRKERHTFQAAQRNSSFK